MRPASARIVPDVSSNRRSLLDKAFFVSLVLKGLDGAVELIAGFASS